MSAFIFCLIFIQVSIFLMAGVVLVSTFYLGLRKPAQAAETPPEPVVEPAAPARSFRLADVTLTRSELNFLLGA